jgi:hypothetical protein
MMYLGAIHSACLIHAASISPAKTIFDGDSSLTGDF